MNKEIRAQTHTLMKGILEIIPIDLINLISESELGIILSGISKIDGFFIFRCELIYFSIFVIVVNDMMETAILSCYTLDAPIIVWFWQILEEYNEEQRAAFHFFVSGSTNKRETILLT